MIEWVACFLRFYVSFKLKGGTLISFLTEPDVDLLYRLESALVNLQQMMSEIVMILKHLLGTNSIFWDVHFIYTVDSVTVQTESETLEIIFQKRNTLDYYI